MAHPVLDAFDRLATTLAVFADPVMPPTALVFTKGRKPALLALGPDHTAFVPVEDAIPTAHKLLAFKSILPALMDAAWLFQLAFNKSPGVAEVFGYSALTFTASADDGSLRFSLWPKERLETVQNDCSRFAYNSTPLDAARAALVGAVESEPKTGGLMPRCSVFDANMRKARLSLQTYPNVLAAFIPLLPYPRPLCVQWDEKDVVQGHEPAPYAPGTHSFSPAEKEQVQAAYAQFAGVLRDLPPSITAIFFEDQPCAFFDKNHKLPNGYGLEKIERPAAQKQPIQAPLFQAPLDGEATWVDVGTQAWHAFVAAFPPGRQWGLTTPNISVAREEVDETPGFVPSIVFDTHSGARFVDMDKLDAWLLPQGAHAFRVKTNADQAPVLVSADSFEAAAALACRILPPSDGYPATVKVHRILRA